MKIALIGTGSIAQRHLQVLNNEPEIEIVGHVSPTPAHAVAAAERWGGRAYSNYQDLLHHEAPDAVWICVTPNAHGALEQDLIAASIPFFVEKPLATDRHTAEQIADAVDRTNVIAGVGYHWRALDTLADVRQALQRNPPHMVLGAWHDGTPPPRWWHKQGESGGQIVEQATHLVDLARHLVGEADVIAGSAGHHPRATYPDLDVATHSAAMVRFRSGATGVFTATCLLAGAAAVHVQLVCDGLVITITQASVTYDWGRERREVRTGNDPFVREDRAFLDAVRRNDPAVLLSSYADALRTHQLCCAMRDAAR
jgi:myo-inositol 2-dehydrogenase/D-chiro-inositol 1-dehydrogenase